MTDRRTDPQGYHEVWQTRLALARELYQGGGFLGTEAIFRATLKGLGYTDREADAEVRLEDDTRAARARPQTPMETGR